MNFGLEFSIAGLAAICVWAVYLWFKLGHGRVQPRLLQDERIEFTIRQNRIAHLSPAALKIITDMGISPELDTVVGFLAARYPMLTDLDLMATHDIRWVKSGWRDDPSQLQCTPTDGGITLTVVEQSIGRDIFKLRRDSHLLDQIERVVGSTPFPVWQSLPDGSIRSANVAFRTLPDAHRDALHMAATGLEKSGERVCIHGGDGKPHWYDINFHNMQDRVAFYALDVTAVVKAEQAQRNFVQTLTKTFATLSIGLAIFDRNRQLMLFNPALVDLTTLPAEFLSARPNLLSVFDRLRDKHIMPEPKNYASWREKLALVVAAAAEGTFTEVWNLPTGETYRISGRPHPDGALAFLFEDITAEVSATRKVRTELEMYQNLLDQVDTAVAIFSLNGKLVLTNSAYDEFWGMEQDTVLAAPAITDASRQWQSAAQPSRFWGELRNFVHQIDERSAWREHILLNDGTPIECQVIPLPNNHTAVTFCRGYNAPNSPTYPRQVLPA